MSRTHALTSALVVALVAAASGAAAQTTAAQPAAAQAPAPPPAPPAPGTTTIKATVVSTDATARRLLVKTEQGATVSLGVPESITQFADLKAGDVVTVSFLDYQVTQIAKAPAAAPAAAPAPGWEIVSKDGSAAVKVGFLAQPQYEALETADEDSYLQNIYLRRMRILFGGRIAKKWLFFFETDSPNLGKSTQAAAPGAKDAGSMFIQDAYFTFDAMPAFKVDAGLILVPLSHNHTQSAASLLPVDYGPYTFLESGPLQERVGRDYGVQLRGYPIKSRIEYRLALFQGLRGADAGNPLRFTGRVQVNLLSADTGFFYLGTAQGTRQILSFGTFLDKQKDYQTTGFDAFTELNVKKMFGFTGQFNWMRFDGGDFVTSLPKQDTMLIEAGVHLARGLTPFVQWATRDYDNPLLKDTDQEQYGLAIWFKGHQRNLKVGVGRQHVDGGVSRTHAQVQLQFFYF